jgi:DNA-binding transcriptional MerR regulator
VRDELAEPGLTVAQMAAATGVSAHTLRYYERAGLIQPIARNSGNQRRYSESDVEWVQFLLRLRETGMPIARMREYAELRANGTSTLHARLGLLEAHRAGLHDQIPSMRALACSKRIGLACTTRSRCCAATRKPSKPRSPPTGTTSNKE